MALNITPDIVVLAVCILTITILYASVGQGGGSGYLAAMALFGLAPEVMKPTALALNIAVTAMTTARYAQAGHFSWPLSWPFLVSSLPCAFVGGAIALRSSLYSPLVGCLLLAAAYRLCFRAPATVQHAPQRIPLPAALLSGAVIGWLSGLTGIGGGIFLSPLVLMLGWAGPRQTAALSSAFILGNSIAGILGYWLTVRFALPAVSWHVFAVWIGASIVGGWLGSELGSHRLADLTMQRLLALLLVAAGVKLILL
jgi:uncharacterized membrane protein YfcA